MSDIKVDRASRDDFGAIAGIWERHNTEVAKKNPEFPLKRNMSYLFNEHLNKVFLDPKQIILVAKKNDSIVGFGLANLVDMAIAFNYPKIGHIENLCVLGGETAKEAQEALIEALAAWFKSKGAGALQLSLYDTSPEVVSPFIDLGFKFVKSVFEKRI